MHNNLSNDSFRVVTAASQQFGLRAGFLVLLGFAIIRPLSLMASTVGIGGFGILDFVGVGVSYLLLIPFFLGLRKFQANLIDFLILFFCLYAAASLFWGSEIRKVLQAILPFLLYFSARMFILQTRQLNFLLFALFLGFLLPIALSTFNVALGRNIQVVEIWNELPRHGGAFAGSHILGYVMLFFSFFYCILNQVYPFKNFLYRSIPCLFLILSIYCLYQSHTRTCIFGFVIFWFIYLWGNNKKLFYGAIVLSIFVGIMFQSNIKSLIWKKQGVYDINRATSGRTSFWVDNIKVFIDSSLPHQLIGRGLGHDHLFMFHNDYIALLMNIGVIGLFFYLFLLIILLWDIFLFKDKKIKFLFGAILISTAAINFGSNAVIFRVELSQYFWLFMGLFYSIPQIQNSEYDT